MKKFFNVGFEAIQVVERQAFGLKDIARYPLFTPEFLEQLAGAFPRDRHDALVHSIVVTARRPLPATPGRPAGKEEVSR